jgi:signal transduction histidine kinase
VDRVLADTLEQIASVRSAMRVPARTTIPGNLQPLVTDEAKLRRVLINLIGNAGKFTEKGHLHIAVRADESGKPLRIDVIDTGIGIPAERLGAVFERFEQADNSTQRKFGGTGLGLAISRTLCELLGYRLSVVSELGVGSAFTILLDPAAQGPISYAELASEPAAAQSEVVCS